MDLGWFDALTFICAAAIIIRNRVCKKKGVEPIDHRLFRKVVPWCDPRIVQDVLMALIITMILVDFLCQLGE